MGASFASLEQLRRVREVAAPLRKRHTADAFAGTRLHSDASTLLRELDALQLPGTVIDCAKNARVAWGSDVQEPALISRPISLCDAIGPPMYNLDSLSMAMPGCSDSAFRICQSWCMQLAADVGPLDLHPNTRLALQLCGVHPPACQGPRDGTCQIYVDGSAKDGKAAWACAVVWQDLHACTTLFQGVFGAVTPTAADEALYLGEDQPTSLVAEQTALVWGILWAVQHAATSPSNCQLLPSWMTPCVVRARMYVLKGGRDIKPMPLKKGQQGFAQVIGSSKLQSARNTFHISGNPGVGVNSNDEGVCMRVGL